MKGFHLKSKALWSSNFWEIKTNCSFFYGWLNSRYLLRLYSQDPNGLNPKIEQLITLTVHTNEFSDQDVVFNPENFPWYKPKDILIFEILEKKSDRKNSNNGTIDLYYIFIL